MQLNSWGRLARYPHTVMQMHDRGQRLPLVDRMLPFGNGRSYGDVCLNAEGTLICTRLLDRWIAFDQDTGILECEAGALLDNIIDLTLPRGWLPAVCPGTALVTVGGAIANDVHGKNHHWLGSFGHHVLSFELLRSDGQMLTCSPQENRDWFCATVGGLGLTGLIRSARLQLRRVQGPWIAGDNRRFSNLEGFFEANAASQGHEYTVAWLDCTATGRRLGRGVFTQGAHLLEPESDAQAPTPLWSQTGVRVPLTPPIAPVFGSGVRIFNACVYRRPSAQRSGMRWHFRRFQFPLDRVRDWNRLYGPKGFFQYQCVLPEKESQAALQEMLQRIARSKQGSFLSVLKKFGDMPSLGLMSFPRPGITLALDFPNRGATTLRLLESLDEITRAAGGAVYPAKDARMSARSFRQFFPAWQEFHRYIDPRFSSSFWRRVTE